MSVMLVSALKDEGPFILEFVAHHAALGFDRIAIAANDCSDGSVRLLRALARAGWIDVFPHKPPEGVPPLHSGYMTVRRNTDLDQHDWVLVLDIDEFLNIHTGDGSIKDYLAKVDPEVDVVAISSACFGGNPETHWRPGFMRDLFHHRHDEDDPACKPVKCLMRNPSDYREMHCHSMVGYRGAKSELVVQTSGGESYLINANAKLWEHLRHSKPERVSFRDLQLNHHAVRTWDTFRLRQRRGRGSASRPTDAKRYTRDYYDKRAFATEHDVTIDRYDDKFRAIVAQMLADPDIAAMHQTCLDIMARRIGRLQDLPEDES